MQQKTDKRAFELDTFLHHLVILNILLWFILKAKPLPPKQLRWNYASGETNNPIMRKTGCIRAELMSPFLIDQNVCLPASFHSLKGWGEFALRLLQMEALKYYLINGICQPISEVSLACSAGRPRKLFHLLESWWLRNEASGAKM